MPRFSANLSFLFTERPFLERFSAARAAGFAAVEFHFPYEFDRAVLAEVVLTSGLDVVLFTQVTGNGVRAGADKSVAPRIAIETDLREVITAIVEAGGGYSILPRTVAERMAARGSGDVRVAEIIPTISRRIGVVHRRGTLSPAGRAFLDLVLRSLPPD